MSTYVELLQSYVLKEKFKVLSLDQVCSSRTLAATAAVFTLCDYCLLQVHPGFVVLKFVDKCQRIKRAALRIQCRLRYPRLALYLSVVT